MDELIKLITGKLGIDSATANAGVCKLMAILKEHVGSDLFNQIAGAVPGADAAATQAEASAEPAAGGGLLGKIAGMASTALGSKAGGGLELASALSSAGIDKDKISPFVTTVIGFLREKLDDETVDQIVGKFPLLKSFLG